MKEKLEVLTFEQEKGLWLVYGSTVVLAIELGELFPHCHCYEAKNEKRANSKFAIRSSY